MENITARTTRVSALDDSRLRVGTISGYSVDVKNTDADCLKGNYVAVGKGCRIGLVQYVNAVQLDPAAEVERGGKDIPQLRGSIIRRKNRRKKQRKQVFKPRKHSASGLRLLFVHLYFGFCFRGLPFGFTLYKAA